jgi:hypothetical protein
MWTSRTKTDLIVEVWEKLDCESIGAAELEAIEVVVRAEYGDGAIESPMIVARLLADEGAELRHSEIMELYLARAADRPYDAALRNVVDISDLKSCLASIRKLENLRRKYRADNDKDGLRHVKTLAIATKELAAETGARQNVDPVERLVNQEAAQWFTIWLQTPDVFDNWVDLRQSSQDFKDKFRIKATED